MKGAMRQVEAGVGHHQNLHRLQPHRLRLSRLRKSGRNKLVQHQHGCADDEGQADLDDDAVEQEVDDVVQPMPARR